MSALTAARTTRRASALHHSVCWALRWDVEWFGRRADPSIGAVGSIAQLDQSDGRTDQEAEDGTLALRDQATRLGTTLDLVGLGSDRHPNQDMIVNIRLARIFSDPEWTAA